jgi:hypothetical protein
MQPRLLTQLIFVAFLTISIACLLKLPMLASAEYSCGPGFRTASHVLSTDTGFSSQPAEVSCDPSATPVAYGMPGSSDLMVAFWAGLAGNGRLLHDN